MPSRAFYPEGALPHQPSPPPRANSSFARVACLGDIDMCGLSLTPSPRSASKRQRGPWDDSSSIELRLDVDSLLAVPAPVIVFTGRVLSRSGRDGVGFLELCNDRIPSCLAPKSNSELS
ncbi:hypothetical protein EDC04DRAFT_2654133 [Pisolithus marmoratus]|nr:hypothetical protein EDC04DRAFT_2654133 [Pisolithus marmoratus]